MDAVTDPFQAVRPLLLRVEEGLRDALATGGSQVSELATHLLAGGKRLRPALVVLSGNAVGAKEDALVPAAIACEIIHMATLVHDDLIDASDRRRGVPTVHAKWGVPMSVLIGDHLFARGFSILSAHGDPRLVRVMSDVVSVTCAGEIDEIQAQWDPEVTVEGYRRRVHGKTGYFIAECCRMGALAGQAPVEWTSALGAYGASVGDCFQIVDDLLDLTATAEALGKPTGSDLRAGVYTLPVAWALGGPDGPALRRLLARRPVGDDTVDQVRALLERSGALEYAAGQALALVEQAVASLRVLPAGPAREALAELAVELAHRVR